ncbi:MAG: hypothetical protein JNM00_13040 [Flavobacteriales bacterium]|nr:hypothetical protein [Flavobacteriales bacterium]
MIRWLFLLCLLAACTPKIYVMPIRGILETGYQRVLIAESEVLAPFLIIDKEHRDLMSECRRPDLHPYSQLDSLYGVMLLRRKSVSEQRAKLQVRASVCNTYQARTYPVKSLEGQELVKLRLDLDSTATFWESRIPEQQATRDQYDQLREDFGIRVISFNAYADTLNPFVETLADSVEMQGKLIAQVHRNLELRFPDQKDPGFRPAYEMISRLQKMHKEYQGLWQQLEVAQGRFLESNPDTYFARGPHMPIPFEVEAANNMILALHMTMNDFRLLYNEALVALK